MGNGFVELDVDSVYTAGGGVTDRSTQAGSHARGLVGHIEAAHSLVGHPEVRSALSELTAGVRDPAAKLPGLITAIGHGVSATAAVARDSDIEGARAVRQATAPLTHLTTKVQRSINPDRA